MKAYKYLLAGVCSMFMFSSCLEEFQKLNTDKEQLGETDPAAIFTGATKDYMNRGRSHLTGKYSGVMSIMQYLVSSGGASNGIYVNPDKPNEHPSPSNQSYSDYYGYTALYLNHLVNEVIPYHAEKERYADIQAIAQILLNHQQWLVLDCYGAAPINEAFKVGEGIRTPKYDLYKDMYKQLDSEVKAAVATLKASGANQYNLGTNDFFYNGDVAKWAKFGNTLRVLMAQRLEKMDQAHYNSVISDVLTSASNVIASNDESCVYHHTNDYNDNTDDIQDITSGYVASAAFVNYLVAYNDPRLQIMVRPNGFGTGNNNDTNDEWFETFKKEYPDYETTYARYAANRYLGMSANPDSAESLTAGQAYLTLPYHKADGTEANLEIRMYSQVESRYFVKNGGRNGNNNMPARAIEHIDYEKDWQSMHDLTPVITYPQTCFMLAEIAVKKNADVAGKSATAWMKAGIRASMEQYREWAEARFVVAQTAATSPTYNPLTDAEIDAYLAQPEFQEATLEKIISQQWINLYKQPEEMWAVWKRTGLPAFKAQPTPENGVAYLEEIKLAGMQLTVPRRNQLPTPNTLNIDNYNAAVQALCQDAKYGTGVANTEGRIWWDAE